GVGAEGGYQREMPGFEQIGTNQQEIGLVLLDQRQAVFDIGRQDQIGAVARKFGQHGGQFVACLVDEQYRFALAAPVLLEEFDNLVIVVRALVFIQLADLHA